ncbi:MAG: NRDE family protein [Desulfomonilaceae bacterium]|jgi:uncharacterized protein with NRDE domain
MCLVLLSFKNHPRYRLVLAGNRDEFYDRPTAPADFWEDDPNVVAGRDLKEGGTWMGVTRTGRIAVLTNFRDPSHKKSHAPSRGHVVSDFLKSRETPLKYIQTLVPKAHSYNDFNLLLGDNNQIYFMSNRNGKWRSLAAGIYGLSNHLLDTPWPKVKCGRDAFMRILSQGHQFAADAIFKILADRTQPDDRLLPDTGIGIEWERILAPIFVASSDYGTRSSVILLIDFEDNVIFMERSYDNSDPSQFSERKFEFRVSDPESNNLW